MSETVDGRVGLCSTFWQRSDDGVWISDGGRDTADPDEFQAALALIDRLARELREQVQATLAEQAAGDKHANDALRYAGEVLELRAEVARLREEMELRQRLYDTHPGPREEELAAFRALAVEAKRQAHQETERGSGVCRECGVHDWWPCLTSRLAALAPKEASDAK